MELCIGISSNLFISWIIILTSLMNLTMAITLFDKSKSYAIFDLWNITRAGKLELEFKTQSAYCMLLYIDSKKFTKTDFSRPETGARLSNIPPNKSFLEIALIQGRLELTFQVESEKHQKTLTLGENLNDLEWHTLTITKFMAALQVDVDKQIKIINFQNNIAGKFKIESRLFIGGLSENKQMVSFGTARFMPRFFGCIENLKYSSGSMNVKPALRVLKGESVAAKCLDACGINPCQNGGKCINLFTRAACDCSGTGYDGEKCTKPADSVHLQNDDHIKWSLKDISSFKHRLSLKFRLKAVKGDGVIFYTKRGGNILLVELVGGNLRMAGGKTSDIPKGIVLKPSIFDGSWHSVDIIRDYHTISIGLDLHKPVNLTVETERLDIDLSEPVYIGGVDSEYTFGVVSRNNFVGCLQQFFYNKNDVIYKVQNTISKYIQKVGQIKPGCPYNRSNINLPTLQPVTTNIHTEGFSQKETVIKEIHTREGGMGQNVIIWITTAIVIGTIIILISAACVVHHVRLKYYRMKAQQKEQNKETLTDDDTDDESAPMKEIEPDEKSHDSSSRAVTPTINNDPTRQCKENDEHVYILHDAGGEVSEV